MIRSSRRFDGPQFGLGEDVQGKRGSSDLHSQPHFSGALFSTIDPGNVSGNAAALAQTAFAIRRVFDRQNLKARRPGIFMNPRALGLVVMLFLGVTVLSWGEEGVGTKELVQDLERGTPFSFVYDGKPAQSLLPSWKRSETERPLGDGRTLRTITYRDPSTQLEVKREITIFPGTNAIEWVLTLHNAGSQDTPILENILPLDVVVKLAQPDKLIFHHVHGSAVGWLNDYVPVDKEMASGEDLELAHYVFENGKHSDTFLPFFNAQWSSGGLMVAIGWTGQWMVRASRSPSGLVLKSGQQKTHLKLHAGESIRTPRVLLVQWQGADRLTGQNALRKVLLAYYVPRVHGEVAMPPVAHTGAYELIFNNIAEKTGKDPLEVLPTLQQVDLGGKGGRGFADPNDALNYVTGKNQLNLIRTMPPIGVEAYWLDAGWFVGGWPSGRGSWVPNDKFSEGMAALGAAAHEKGFKYLLWFDPEGVAHGSMIEKEHPQWVLHQPQEGEWGGIFRFSDPAATRWMTDMLASRIRDWHIDIFRMDRNTNPVPFWQAADTPDRVGMTEIAQIEGLYAMWDGLLERFPGLEIDNANWRVTGPDIEAMRRTIGSLTRSEVTNGGVPNAIADQVHTAELTLWVPFDANILHGVDPYNFRSTATTGVGIGLDLNSPYVSRDELRKAITEEKSLRPYWLGDYYPLTPINLQPDVWCGWQFDRPDLKAGFAMFFRRPKSGESTFRASLHGIEPGAVYKVSLAETYDAGPQRTMTGAELQNLQVTIEKAPGSVLVRYEKSPTAGAPARNTASQN
jgi:alpha-galactosidase